MIQLHILSPVSRLTVLFAVFGALTLSQAQDTCIKFEGSPRKRDLLYCQEHSRCTCCNASTSLLIKRQSLSTQSPACAAAYQKFVCRHCSAQVGTGSVVKMCTTFCTALYESCKQDYFEHIGVGELVACKPNSYLCSTLSEFASSSEQMCRELGLFNGQGHGSCYNGEPSEMTESCLKSRSPSLKARKGASLRARSKAVMLLLCKVSAVLITVAVVLFWLKQPPAKQTAMPNPTHVFRGRPRRLRE